MFVALTWDSNKVVDLKSLYMCCNYNKSWLTIFVTVVHVVFVDNKCPALKQTRNITLTYIAEHGVQRQKLNANVELQ